MIVGTSLNLIALAATAGIVQTRKDTVSYGKGFASNTQCEWPSRLPLLGLARVTLPVSNFANKPDPKA